MLDITPMPCPIDERFKYKGVLCRAGLGENNYPLGVLKEGQKLQWNDPRKVSEDKNLKKKLDEMFYKKKESVQATSKTKTNDKGSESEDNTLSP
jgi:hypothetical protein